MFIAKTLLLVLGVLGFFVALPYYIMNTDWSALERYFLNIAISLDQTGNTICKVLFDLTLIDRYSINKFGNVDETISSVIGKNKRDNTLSFLGKILSYILDNIDNNHSIKSIEEEEVQRYIR